MLLDLQALELVEMHVSWPDNLIFLNIENFIQKGKRHLQNDFVTIVRKKLRTPTHRHQDFKLKSQTQIAHIAIRSQYTTQKIVPIKEEGVETSTNGQPKPIK